jgi:hypothetical protein
MLESGMKDHPPKKRWEHMPKKGIGNGQFPGRGTFIRNGALDSVIKKEGAFLRLALLFNSN